MNLTKTDAYTLWSILEPLAESEQDEKRRTRLETLRDTFRAAMTGEEPAAIVFSNERAIAVPLNSHQGVVVSRLLSLRMEYLCSINQTGLVQAEFQALRSVARQIRDQVQAIIDMPAQGPGESEEEEL